MVCTAGRLASHIREMSGAGSLRLMGETVRALPGVCEFAGLIDGTAGLISCYRMRGGT